MSLKPAVSDPNWISENEATCGDSVPDLDISDVSLTPGPQYCVDGEEIHQSSPDELVPSVDEQMPIRDEQILISDEPPPPPPYTLDPSLDKEPQVVDTIEYREIEFTDQPMELQCYKCLSNITTRIEHHYSHATWITMAILFILGLWPCVPIPLCVKSLMDVTHYCPNCSAYLGVYYRI